MNLELYLEEFDSDTFGFQTLLNILSYLIDVMVKRVDDDIDSGHFRFRLFSREREVRKKKERELYVENDVHICFFHVSILKHRDPVRVQNKMVEQ